MEGSKNMNQDELFMKAAIIEAKKALKLQEVPIGAVVVHNNQIIGRGFNTREMQQKSTGHAEMMAIEEACKNIGSWRLEETTLYVTLEPCPMCAGAIMLSRIQKVVYGAGDPKGGCAGTILNILQEPRFNHQCEILEGVLADECSTMLTDFFRSIRQKKKNGRSLNN